MGALFLIVFTITEKYKMIHYCKKPPRLSHKFVQISTIVLSIGLCLHLIFSILMLGSPYIFNESTSSTLLLENTFRTGSSKSKEQDFLTFFDATENYMKFWKCLPLSILLAFSVCCLVLFPIVSYCISTRLKSQKKDRSVYLKGEVLKTVGKNDWPDYDFRFKKDNIIIPYGWDKFCFEIDSELRKESASTKSVITIN